MKWLVSIRSMRLLGVIRASPRVPHIFLPKTSCFPTPKRVLGEKRSSSILLHISIKKNQNLLPHAFSCTVFFLSRVGDPVASRSPPLPFVIARTPQRSSSSGRTTYRLSWLAFREGASHDDFP